MTPPSADELWDLMPSASAGMTPREHTAAVADPQAWRRDGSLCALAEHIAMRADYPEADRECVSVAGRILLEAGGDVDGVIAAYRRLETPRPNEPETFFVRVARTNPPGWQVRQVVSEWKRGEPKSKSWILPEYRDLVER